jgi:hypothetical protein
MTRYSAVLIVTLPAIAFAFPVLGASDGLPDTVVARLSGFQEVPTLSTSGRGRFLAEVTQDAITYRLEYSDLESEVAQAHIHLGRRATNGGISVFLCTNLGNASAEVQPCPPGDGEISGTIMAADVIGPGDQGIAAGEFEELLDALARRAAYVNVHTADRPDGEIRGQVASVRHSGKDIETKTNHSMTMQ